MYLLSCGDYLIVYFSLLEFIIIDFLMSMVTLHCLDTKEDSIKKKNNV